MNNNFNEVNVGDTIMPTNVNYSSNSYTATKHYEVIAVHDMTGAVRVIADDGKWYIGLEKWQEMKCDIVDVKENTIDAYNRAMGILGP